MATDNVPADTGGKENHLQNLLSDNELSKISQKLTRKINDYIDIKYNEYLVSKALYETNRNASAEKISVLENELLKVTATYEDSKSKSVAIETANVELERQLAELKSALQKANDSVNSLESEVQSLKHARDEAVDERNNLSRALQRRDAELERLRADETALTAQLRAAIDAKCEALAANDEVQSRELTLQYRERRMEQERAMLNSQVATLQEEVNRLSGDSQSMRLNNTSRTLTLESQVTERSEELKVAKNTIVQLNETVENLNKRCENLAKRLSEQREIENKMVDNYKQELEAKNKLADLYKGMQDDAEAKAVELTEGVAELQKLLHEATEKYGQLETKSKQVELELEDKIEKLNETMSSLKTELENANEVIKTAHSDNLDTALGELAPSAAAASRLLKSGMSLTQVYSQLVTLSEQLAREKDENRSLSHTVNSILDELEQKAPYIQRQKELVEETQEQNVALKQRLETLSSEYQQLRDDFNESVKVNNQINRENSRIKGELADLGRQVCFLLKEVEQNRGGSIPNHNDHMGDLNDSSDLSSSRILSKNLVTFHDIQELQKNNQKLLRLVRELTEKQEELERSCDQLESGEMQKNLTTLTNRVTELTEAQDRQTKMVNGLIRQRDMYKKLYHDNINGRAQEVPKSLDQSNGSLDMSHNESDSRNVSISQQQADNSVLETKLKETEKYLELLKEEHKTYKEEKLTNEKMLFEQIDNMRSEIAKLTSANSKCSAAVEYSSERMKILQANNDTYKKQITSLEEKSKAYSETIAKHEVSLQHLRDETMNAQGKLVKSEVTLENLRQENKLLKDAENRLISEREMLNRERQGQSLLLNNLEMIKVSLERSETEGRLRLETRLDEATRECCAVRRRLNEEQDRFRELASHLEKETETAKQRMEEEKTAAKALRSELSQLRENIASKSQHNEELTQKLKLAMTPNKPDGTFDTLKKIKELENQVKDKKNEIDSFKEQLAVSKEHIKQYCDISESAEKELKSLSETYTKYKEETDAKLQNAQSKEQQLQDRCSELEAELSLESNGRHGTITELKAQLAKAQAELQESQNSLGETKTELDVARQDIAKLSQNLQIAEDKYSHEMVLHSSDIQALTALKTELSKTQINLNELKQAKDEVLMKLEADKSAWSDREKLLQSERDAMQVSMAELVKQNTVLHDQIQALGTQLSVAHAPKLSDSMSDSTHDISLNHSFNEDDRKSSEQLFQIIKFLRKEKDIAIAKYDILQAENIRLKSQLEIIEKKLDESKLALAAVQEKSEVSVVTMARHSDILRKVETLNAITDSNRILRQERDSMLSTIQELTAAAKKYEEDLTPLRIKIGDITSKNDTLMSENTSLKAETARWRARVNALVERANKTSPEDWKRLQNERDMLVKMLTNEKETVKKLNEELNNLKIEKTKIEDQIHSLTNKHHSMEEDFKKQTEELNSIKRDLSKLTEELHKTKETSNIVTAEKTTMMEEISSKDAQLLDAKRKELQLRNIAKKYKGQFEELTKTVEEQKQNENKPIKDLEICQQRVAAVEGQLTAAREESIKLKTEIEDLTKVKSECEEKAKLLLKTARQKITQLENEKDTLTKELAVKYADTVTEENAPPSNEVSDEQDVRFIALQSNFDGKVAKLEKEKTELQTERTKEIEALQQKITLLQRQLASQSSGSKQQPSGSDKATSDPPTANIKPMAGVAQQSVGGIRRGGDTPLASIRPMAQLGARTAAVLPTSAPGPSTAAVDAPSPTSSHTTEYMPASSSRPLPHHYRVMATPQHTPPHVPGTAHAESTQDMDVEARPVSASDVISQQATHSQPPQQVVALVMPRMEQTGASVSAGTAVVAVVTGSAAAAAGEQQAASSTGPGNSGVSTSGNETRAAKRARPPPGRTVQPNKRTRVQVFERSVDIEYQVPTSSRCDQDEEGVILVDSEEEEDNQCSAYQEGEVYAEEEDEEEDAQEAEEGEADADMEGEEEEGRAGQEDEGEGSDNVGENDTSPELCAQMQEDGSQELGVQSSAEAEDEVEASGEGREAGEAAAADPPHTEGQQHQQIETISSGTEPPSNLTLNEAVSAASHSSHAASTAYEEGDDSIVPSTPTLYVPRRNDGFGEAVSSPLAGVPSASSGVGGRFTFGEAGAGNMEDTHADLASQLAAPAATSPHTDTTPATGEEREGGRIREEGSEETLAEDDAVAVSSQGSQPASPHQTSEEGREAEATASPSSGGSARGSPRRRPFRAQPHRPAPIVWPNEGEGGMRGGGGGMRGGRGVMRGRGMRRPHNPFQRY